MEIFKLKPLTRALAPSIIILGLTACGGGSDSGDNKGGDDNTAPIASINPLTTPQSMGNTISLNGENSSDADNDDITYHWSIVSAPTGSTASITNSSSMVASLLGDLPGDYTIELVVNDGKESSLAVSTTITLTNTAPVANAGNDQPVDLDGSVQLNGSASSDIDGQILAFQWQIVEAPSGSSAYLDNPGSIMPTLFGIDEPGNYRVGLIVNDGFVESAQDSVLISTNNVPPVANAGNDIGGRAVGDSVTLNGSASTDRDGDSLSYSWAFTDAIPAGSGAAIENPNSAMASFTIDEKGSYEVELTVSDGEASNTDIVLVNVGNTSPIAEAGANQDVQVDEEVKLSASGSIDIDGDNLSFIWSFIDKPAASSASISNNNSVNASFIPDVAGTYVIQLLVDDGEAQHTDSMEVYVDAIINQPPIANAGPDQSFDQIGELVMLNGGGSTDPENDTLTYIWTFTDKPSGSTVVLIGADTATPSFIPDVAGQYTVQLSVNDGLQSSTQADSVTINVETNSTPVADAGADQTDIILGQTVQLEGDESYDPDSDDISYAWSVTSAPADAETSFDDSSSATPTLNLDKAGDYLVQLTVNDGEFDHSDTMMINVSDGDLDGDGLDSSFELENGLNPAKEDSDGDGIVDGAEDEDADNLSNQWEAILDYNIDNDDSDSDGIKDGDEDFDNDGYSNQAEISAGTDPTDPDSHPISVADQFSFELKASNVTPGGKLIYKLEVGNVSTVDTLSNLVIRLDVPEGVSFNRFGNASSNSTGHNGCNASGGCGAGSSAFWALGDLSPGDNISFEIDATVGAAVAVGSLINTAVVISSDSLGSNIQMSRVAQVAAELPLIVEVKASDEPIAPGQSFIYEIAVGNVSDDVADNLETILDLPAGISVINVLDGGSVNGNRVTWEDSALLPTQSIVRRVEVKLSSSAKEAAALISTTSLNVDGNQHQQLKDIVTVSEPLKLELQYHARKAVVAAGERLVYDFTISNHSQVNLVENAVMMLRVPAGVSFNRLANASRNSTGHSGCNASGGCDGSDEVFWNLGNLEPGETINFQVNAAIAAGVTPGTLLETPVFMSSDGLGDLIQQEIITQVVAEQEAHLSLSSSHDAVAAEQSFDLQVMFGNNSDDVMENSFINLTVPANLIVNSISHGGTIEGDVISWNTSHLLPTQSLQRTVNVTVAADAKPGDTLSTAAELFFDEGLERDQLASHTLTVSEPLRLQTVFEAAQQVVTPGGRLKYHLTISNTSLGSLVENPVIMMQVPAGISFNRLANTSINSTAHSGCDASGGCNGNDEVFWQLNDLAAGESVTLEINALVSATVEPGTILETPVFIHADGMEDNIHLQRSVNVVAEQQAHFHINSSADAIEAGDDFRYVLDIGNPSDDALENLQWQLELPTGVSVKQLPAGASLSGNTVTWNQALLLPGQALKRELEVTLSNSAQVGSSLLATATLSHDDGLELDQQLHHNLSVSDGLKLELDYSLDQTVVRAGGNVQYAITLSNTSLGSLVENAVVMMQVPAGISFNRFGNTSYSSSGHSGCNASGGCDGNDEVFWSIPQLAAGESLTIHINASVSAAVQPGSLIETPIYVSADGLEDKLQLQRSMHVVASQPVHFTLLASEEPVAPGSSFSYNLTLGNSGNDLVEGIDLELTLPEGLTVDAISNGGTQNGSSISWSAGNLAAANSLVRSIAVTLDENVTLGGALTAVARLRHNGGAELDQELYTSITVAEPQKLDVQFSQDKSSVNPGGTFTYAITLKNTSLGSLSENTGLMLQVPEGISFNRISNATPSSTGHNGCNASGGCDGNDEVFWNLGTLAAGEQVTVEISATVAVGVSPGSIIKTPIFVNADGLKDNIVLHQEVVITQP